LRFYLDASVIVPLAVREAMTDKLSAFADAPERELFVSEFAAAEVASTLSRLVREGRFTRGQAEFKLSDLDIWRATRTLAADVQASDMRAAHVIVRRFELKLRTPDALHLAVARRIGAALVTLDGRLAAAAAEVGVPVQQPV
jgi:predicted nucleic acid-binding protein